MKKMGIYSPPLPTKKKRRTRNPLKNKNKNKTGNGDRRACMTRRTNLVPRGWITRHPYPGWMTSSSSEELEVSLF